MPSSSQRPPRLPSAIACALLILPALCGGPIQAQTKSIPYTIRDFSAAHPDFESPSCYGGKNMVQTELDASRKPWHNASNFCADNQLKDWFRDSPASTRYCKDMSLTRKAGTENTFEYSNDFFFPLDGAPTSEGGLPPGQDGKPHNFHFCMEMHATFKYRGGEVFDFLGDDDVWVYINRKLALDLGGVHTPQSGKVDLDAMKTGLGIATGNYYDFDFFFCERQTIGSHLWLNTSIDILPPPAPGYHIADADMNLIPEGDTVDAYQGQGARILKAAEIGTRNETIDCSDVSTQVKNPVDADWSIAGKALPHGTQVSIDPDAYPGGTYLVRLTKNGLSDSVWVRIRPLPIAAMPKADPPGQAFNGNLPVTLSSPSPGAVIHYTTDGSDPTSASPVYNGRIPVTSSLTLKAVAIAPGHRTSPVMSERYTRTPAAALKGWYQDRDGDGRIETAVIVFDSPFPAPPAHTSFIDPFTPSQAEEDPALTADPLSISAVLRPFSPGTGFSPSGLARIGAEPDAFLAQTVIMEDSVGPVLSSGRAFPPSGGSHPALEVEFSEPVNLDLVSKDLPFELKRGTNRVDPANLIVQTVTRISPVRYRFEFAPGSAYPVPRDSMRIALDAGVSDLPGNPSRMSYLIPLSGDPVHADAKIAIVPVRGVTRGPTLEGKAGEAVIVAHGGGVCLNCAEADVARALPVSLPGELNGMGPTWRVTTRFPFRYAFSVFDNLGHFVNRAEGEVPAGQLARVPRAAGADDSTRVELTLLPFASDGNPMATGAYILKGTVSILGQAAQKGPQGEDVLIVPAAQGVVLRFGYLRK